jgi:hypothetical protein
MRSSNNIVFSRKSIVEFIFGERIFAMLSIFFCIHPIGFGFYKRGLFSSHMLHRYIIMRKHLYTITRHVI